MHAKSLREKTVPCRVSAGITRDFELRSSSKVYLHFFFKSVYRWLKIENRFFFKRTTFHFNSIEVKGQHTKDDANQQPFPLVKVQVTRSLFVGLSFNIFFSTFFKFRVIDRGQGLVDSTAAASPEALTCVVDVLPFIFILPYNRRPKTGKDTHTHGEKKPKTKRKFLGFISSHFIFIKVFWWSLV